MTKKTFDDPPAFVSMAADIANAFIDSDAAETGRPASTKQISVPMPLHMVATAEVLGEAQGLSRGAMVARLAEIGADLVLHQLDPEKGGLAKQRISAKTKALLPPGFDLDGE